MLSFLTIIPGIQYLAIAWSFLTSRIGQLIVLGVVTLFLGWHLAAKHEQVLRDRAVIAEQTGRIEDLQRKLNDATQIANDASQRERTSVEQAEEMKQRIDAYVVELANRHSTRCALSDADVRRLRQF